MREKDGPGCEEVEEDGFYLGERGPALGLRPEAAGGGGLRKLAMRWELEAEEGEGGFGAKPLRKKKGGGALAGGGKWGGRGVQDLLKGENQTVHEVARANITSNSATLFGSVRVLDNPMTAGPDINSEPVGRFQGLVTSADLQILSFAMNINFVFTSGRFRGSSISISGMNQVLTEQRELPVIGGTGAFRFARGYVITTSYFSDPDKSHNVLE
ncbi:UNVERIFIED_CONTAM: Dirigent protein 11 [Sesamum latifolium]|uniref:Dirigent protein n=1 Tax=Sesamum latifolium TaxID=2727402 RepID=A0AAW2V0E0_9LAMI